MRLGHGGLMMYHSDPCTLGTHVRQLCHFWRISSLATRTNGCYTATMTLCGSWMVFWIFYQIWIQTCHTSFQIICGGPQCPDGRVIPTRRHHAACLAIFLITTWIIPRLHSELQRAAPAHQSCCVTPISVASSTTSVTFPVHPWQHTRCMEEQEAS